MTAGVQRAIPETLSVAVKLTVTFVLFQPAALGCGAAAACTIGGVLSILTAGEVYVALLPARSVTVTAPATDEPSLVRDNGLCTDVEATPDTTSDAVKLIATLVLFHPAAFAGGAGDPNLTAGGVLSRLMAICTVPTLPALSGAAPAMIWFGPSVVTGTGEGQVPTPR